MATNAQLQAIIDDLQAKAAAAEAAAAEATTSKIHAQILEAEKEPVTVFGSIKNTVIGLLTGVDKGAQLFVETVEGSRLVVKVGTLPLQVEVYEQTEKAIAAGRKIGMSDEAIIQMAKL